MPPSSPRPLRPSRLAARPPRRRSSRLAARATTCASLRVAGMPTELTLPLLRPLLRSLIHVATPLEYCEATDRKGRYAEARAGKVRLVLSLSLRRCAEADANPSPPCRSPTSRACRTRTRCPPTPTSPSTSRRSRSRRPCTRFSCCSRPMALFRLQMIERLFSVPEGSACARRHHHHPRRARASGARTQRSAQERLHPTSDCSACAQHMSLRSSRAGA